MKKIFYVMGKSASGKDTIYKELAERYPQLKTVRLYTTRPIREGELEGVEYYFTTTENLQKYKEAGKLIEARTYDTIYGPWVYFTVDDGQFDIAHYYYLMIGTLESYEKMQRYFGAEVMVPLYIHVEDGLRLERALKREQAQRKPQYRELCRRFLSDEEDFKKENKERCNITVEYENAVLKKCLIEMCRDIEKITAFHVFIS